MMRWTLLAVLFLAAPTLAQVQVLEDSDGDAVVRLGGLADAPTGFYPSTTTDLLGFTISEVPQAFTFDLSVADLDPDTEVEGDVTFYNVDFNHADRAYRLNYIRQNLGGGVFYGGQVQVYDAARQQYVFHFGDVDFDVDTGRSILSMVVPRDALLDGNGTAPTVGRDFTLFRAFARSSTFGIEGGAPIRVDDAMPDDGFGLDYAVEQGIQQQGHGRLFSDNPVRASNGEEATFVFYVQAVNLAPEDDRFALATEGVPNGWTVTLPASVIRIDGNSTQRFPVLVSTPFSHSHGNFEDFILTLTSQSDSSSVGRLQMGIRYLEVPQPAGHHDRLWIHAEASRFQNFFSPVLGVENIAYFNAIDDDGRTDDSLQVAPQGYGGGPNGNEYRWDLYLEPGLQLGLDFDLDRTGVIDVDFVSDMPMDGVVLTGRLSHYLGGLDGKETVLAEIASTTPKPLSGTSTFSSIITPTAASDFIPYTQEAALVLHLTLRDAGAPAILGFDAAGPRLLPGGELTLPLFEYRDPVENVFNDLAGIELAPSGRAEKYVNPGETVLLNLTLTNSGAVDDVFTLRVNGTNQEWAQLLGDTEVFVATGASRPVIVAVSAPSGALDGDIVDLIVTAASAAEPTISGQARVVAVVDDLLDRDDESHLIDGLKSDLTKDKQSPGPGLALLMVGLLALARRAKRS